MDATRTLPVEYQASLTFEVLDNEPNIVSSQQRIAWLLDLIQGAHAAHYPAMLSYGGPRSGTQFALEEALYLKALHVDSVSIEAESIDRLIPLDRDRAMQAFLSMQLPQSSTSCSDSSTPNYTPYFNTLQRLASLPGSSSDAMPRALLVDAAGRLSSPSAISGYLSILKDVHLESSEWSLVSGRVEQSMALLHPSDRELSALDRRGELSSSLAEVLAKLGDKRQSAVELLQAYRGFLARGLGSEQCSDFSLDRSAIISEFDALRKKAAVTEQVHALEMRDLLGSPSNAAPARKIPFDERLRAPMQKLFALSASNQQKQYVAHDPDLTQPDSQDVTTILGIAQANYEKEDSCAECRFLSKQETLSTLMTLLPQGKRQGPSSRRK
ncbi:hypothetical protein [Acidipila sp. EB88]|uniref:hypothetical protein n=1 Tax=Acidipila sp. EB88 TaxID=2305226 RepID=UPI000F5E75AD|nr:hypothetical protein [Acidipila sp. EB88]RRA49345.1 hypothetical protein D1Y84_14720 [Acidipila sp. EB88]